MYTVIFFAKIKTADQEYFDSALKLRKLAQEEYGCLDFHSVTQENREITISRWPNLDQIRLWREDPLHRQAQELGKTKWYESYRVEILENLRAYDSEEGA